MLPNITATGNLTADPELRYAPSGKAVANFTVACNKKSNNDAYPDKTAFLRCQAWGPLGENIANEFAKGQRISIIRGDLEERKWEKDGETRYSWEVTVWDAGRPVSAFNDDQKPGGKWENTTQNPSPSNGEGGHFDISEPAPF